MVYSDIYSVFRCPKTTDFAHFTGHLGRGSCIQNTGQWGLAAPAGRAPEPCLDIRPPSELQESDLHNAPSFLVALAVAALGTGCGIDLVDTVQDVFTDDPQADLRIQTPQGAALTCIPGPSVVVTVENRGEADAPESITAVVFVPGGSVDVRTDGLGQAESTQIDPVDVPAACFIPDCRFTVLVDASFLVDETDENNNRVDGTCLAAAAPAP